MEGLTSKQDCPHPFKNNRDPSGVQTYAIFPASLFPTALTYTTGATSDTKRWSSGFKHPDVSRCKEVRHNLRVWQITAVFLVTRQVHGESLGLLSSPAPNQLYIMPLTDSQQYGWMMSKSPEPWMQVSRFPRKNSEMTKWVTFLNIILDF